MTCKCGKPLVQREIATKTKEINGDIVIVESKTAQVCEKCGVIAFGPIQYQTYPVPYVLPYPYTPPGQYWGTSGGSTLPNTSPRSPQYPQGGATWSAAVTLDDNTAFTTSTSLQ